MWSPQVKKSMTPDDAHARPHATDLAYIVSRFTNVYAAIRCKLQTDSDITLREALLLDAELEERDMQLPQSLRHRLEQHAEETAVMLKGVSHRYRDFWTARID
jgi:ribosomal protein RSM22 (predicted rRNA methylase)